MRRYSNLEYIENLNIDDFLELVDLAEIKEVEEDLYKVWVSMYPHMDKNSFISFEDFKKKNIRKQMNKKVKPMSDAEILIMVNNIRLKKESQSDGNI